MQDPSSLHVMPAIQDHSQSGSRVPGRPSMLSPHASPISQTISLYQSHHGMLEILLPCIEIHRAIPDMTLPTSITLRTGLQSKRDTISTVAISPHQGPQPPGLS